MKRIVLLLLLSVAVLHADELTKNVQKELKDLGFFYAEVNGTNGPETTAAIRRFQIRNGFEVTGTLTKETLKGLGLNKMHREVELEDTPEVRGMIRSVRHMVEVVG